MFREILLFALLGMALASQKSYQGYKVFQTEPLNAVQTKVLRRFHNEGLKFDFWKVPAVGRVAEIMASPEEIKELEQILNLHRIKHTIKFDNVQDILQAPRIAGVQGKIPQSPSYRLNWDDYHRHAEINEFIEEMAAAHDYITSASIGESYEGRDMRVLQINKAGPGAPNIYIEAGIHAREWIANAVATYTVWELVDNYAAHPQYLDNFNWHVIPMGNPDGYEFSHTNDRLWRKSRSDSAGGLGCLGVDLNRNWGYHYGESGTSTNPCAETYRGEGEFSEIESINKRDYFLSLDPIPVISICFHSAAELWLYPYGYAYDAYPPNVAEIRTMANNAVAALNAVHGEQFEAINSAELYPAAGASDDWYQSQGSRFTYTPELRVGRNTFELPPAEIIPSGEEVFAAWRSMLDSLLLEMENEKKK